MPVVGRGYEDGVDIATLQQFLVVQVCFCARGLAGGLRQALAINVAHRDDLDVCARLLAAQAGFQVIAAARADADLADVDAVVRTGDTGGRERRARQPDEAASGELIRHHCRL
jgi:hypothetical protein